jgi:hypothetical protein
MGICINCVFSVDEVNTTQVTLRNIQWMDLASKTIAARPSTKVIQYLLNEATRFVACDSLPVDQWMRIKKKFHFYIATL